MSYYNSVRLGTPDVGVLTEVLNIINRKEAVSKRLQVPIEEAWLEDPHGKMGCHSIVASLKEGIKIPIPICRQGARAVTRRIRINALGIWLRVQSVAISGKEEAGIIVNRVIDRLNSVFRKLGRKVRLLMDKKEAAVVRGKKRPITNPGAAGYLSHRKSDVSLLLPRCDALARRVPVAGMTGVGNTVSDQEVSEISRLCGPPQQAFFKE